MLLENHTRLIKVPRVLLARFIYLLFLNCFSPALVKKNAELLHRPTEYGFRFPREIPNIYIQLLTSTTQLRQHLGIVQKLFKGCETVILQTLYNILIRVSVCVLNYKH